MRLNIEDKGLYSLACHNMWLIGVRLMSFSSQLIYRICIFLCLLKIFSFEKNQQISCKHAYRCSHFSIHIDSFPNFSSKHSPIFELILQTIRTSSFFNNDSQSACLYLAPVDTIDRDRRSKHGYYTYFLEQKLRRFSQWTDPTKIHLIFNHYTGTWPSYHRTLDFNLPPHYILASTSFTPITYNCTSHLTFPLFHSDYSSRTSVFPNLKRTILLSFKGKSYEDVQHHRTFFRFLHNNHDIIIQYTDNLTHSFENYDYHQLLHQSHFCLVPTGRRLSSYRLLESLQSACIPVITSNENETLLLPFFEIIDWSTCVIMYIDQPLTLLPYQLRKIQHYQRIRMQRNCFNIWSKYFSSIQTIVLTALEILHERFSSS